MHEILNLRHRPHVIFQKPEVCDSFSKYPSKNCTTNGFLICQTTNNLNPDVFKPISQQQLKLD